MNKDEFQRKYKEYVTDNKDVAIAEAAFANREGIEGRESAVAVNFGSLGYGLMLKSTVKLLVEIGVIGEDQVCL